MTTDEVVFAGGSDDFYLLNSSAWYYVNSLGESVTGSRAWYTMSPYYTTSYGPGTYVMDTRFDYDNNKTYDVYLAGDYNTSDFRYAVRPVVLIDSCAKFKGTGTVTDPYVIDESTSTCG